MPRPHKTPSPVIIHHLEDAIAALKQGASLLQNAPGSTDYAGALFFRMLMEEAARAVPNAKAQFIFDCGESEGAFFTALRLGFTQLKIEVPPVVKKKLQAIAQEKGVTLL